MKIKGLFQIVKKGCGLSTSNEFNIIGTAFAIQTIHDLPWTYYLLTAYHNISEAYAKHEPVLIRDDSDRFYTAEIIYPNLFRPFNGTIAKDYALLKLVAHTEYLVYSLGNITLPSKCYINGAVNYFSSITKFTPFRGEILSTERSLIDSDEEILVLDLLTKSISDSSTNLQINQQNIIAGMSGAPITVYENGQEFLAGVFVRLFPDGVASKCYGIPVDLIISECLLPNGLYSKSYLEDANETYISSSVPTLYDDRLFINLLFDDPATFQLDDCVSETKFWNKVSNQFYQGFPIDRVLYNVTCSNNFSRYRYDVQVAIRYYLARLLFKRGRNHDAYNQFSKVSEITKHLSSQTAQRFSVLMDARDIVESETKNPLFELDQIRFCHEKIRNLRIADEIYIANEIASVIGRGLTNLYNQLEADSCSDSLKSLINDIYCEHSALLTQYPVPLRKQDIVNTSLGWLTNLWKISANVDDVKLFQDIQVGFCQAANRKNSIFHIQVLIAYSIYLLIKDERKPSLTVLFVVALLMHEKNLKISHEGISQLLRYMQLNYLPFFSIFCIFTKYCNEDERVFLEKSNLYSVDVSSCSIGALVQRAHYIIDNIYLPLDQEIYFNNLENLLELI